ncbi:MAG: hypothetical protein AB8D52_12875 [Gammaproteobacteria bacterium]
MKKSNYSELLDNSEFLGANGPNESLVQSSSVDEILEFCEQSASVSEIESGNIDRTQLTQLASLSLSSDTHPCSALDCRMKNAIELAQYAAFYSDNILVNNMLSRHIHHADEIADEDEFREKFIDDLELLHFLKPFIEAGVVQPITPPYYCKRCLAHQSFGDYDDKRIEDTFKRLMGEYKQQTKVYVEKLYDMYFLSIEGPDTLLEHGQLCWTLDTLPESIAGMPRKVSAIESGKKVELSKTVAQKERLYAEVAGSNYQRIAYDLALTNSLEVSLLTNSEIELGILRELSNSSEIDRRNQIIGNNLTCLVPFLKGVDPATVLKIRESEQDSFVSFRSKLNETVNEVVAQKGSLDNRGAYQIYNDLLAPEISKLNHQMQLANNSLTKKARRKVMGWTAAISFGNYVGLLPPGITAAAAALGFTGLIATSLEEMMNNSDAEDLIKSSDMYFLWKVKHLAHSGK